MSRDWLLIYGMGVFGGFITLALSITVGFELGGLALPFFARLVWHAFVGDEVLDESH